MINFCRMRFLINRLPAARFRVDKAFARATKTTTILTGMPRGSSTGNQVEDGAILIEYARQALDSICGQTLKDIEIVCVNDGSTDGSLEILKEYSSKDDRVVVLSQENGGYGKAMNRGLTAARGEYIGIVEPDDYIDPDMYKDLYMLASYHDLDLSLIHI